MWFSAEYGCIRIRRCCGTVELRVVNVEVVLQVVTVDDGGQRGSIKGKEDGS